MSLLASVGQPGSLLAKYTTTVTVLQGTVLSSGIDKGTLDWSAPTTVATVTGDIQPADTKTQELAGLIAKAGRWAAYLEPTAILPETNRLEADGTTYAVLAVHEWRSHTLCVCEEVSAP